MEAEQQIIEAARAVADAVLDVDRYIYNGYPDAFNNAIIDLIVQLSRDMPRAALELYPIIDDEVPDEVVKLAHAIGRQGVDTLADLAELHPVGVKLQTAFHEDRDRSEGETYSKPLRTMVELKQARAEAATPADLYLVALDQAAIDPIAALDTALMIDAGHWYRTDATACAVMAVLAQTGVTEAIDMAKGLQNAADRAYGLALVAEKLVSTDLGQALRVGKAARQGLEHATTGLHGPPPMWSMDHWGIAWRVARLLAQIDLELGLSVLEPEIIRVSAAAALLQQAVLTAAYGGDGIAVLDSPIDESGARGVLLVQIATTAAPQILEPGALGHWLELLLEVCSRVSQTATRQGPADLSRGRIYGKATLRVRDGIVVAEVTPFRGHPA